ncbi:SCO family protein [Sulfidibacter corallicola]
MSTKSLTVVFSGFFLMFLISVGAFFLYEPKVMAAPLPVHGEAPDFRFTDTRGEAFPSDTLDGKVWVADFFFSTCAGPCPAMSGHMGELQTHYRERTDLRLVNFTVYPDHDTPEELAKYATKLKADTDRWHFLTGAADELLRVAVDGFKVGDPDNLLNHSQKFILVDRNQKIRGYYEGTDPEEITQLKKDIDRLLREPVPAKGSDNT